MSSSNSIRWFRSRPTAPGFESGKIDVEHGIIRDVVMVEEGEAKGHGVHLEEEFINDLVAYDQLHFSERGVKARLGHPGASDNTMGMQLGFFRNVRKRRKDGKMQAIGDLHLLDSADQSPTKPNMRAWMLSMAAEAPDFVMSSIVFRIGALYQRKANGHKRPVGMNKWGEPEGHDPELPVFVEFGEHGAHYYTDLVEQGAATDSLFSTQVNDHLYVAQAERFLEEHPHLIKFINQHPEKVHGFLARLGVAAAPASQPSKFSMSKILNYLLGSKDDAGSNTPAPDTVDAAELTALRTEFESARTQVQSLQTERDALKTQLAEAKTTATSLSAQIDDLKLQVQQANARIAELEKEPAAEHSDGPTEPAEKKTRAYENNPVTMRARRYRG